MAEASPSNQAFPNLLDTPLFRGGVELARSAILPLLEATSRLTATHTEIAANGVTIFDTRKETAAAELKSVDFKYENKVLGQVRVRLFLENGSHAAEMPNDKLSAYAAAIFSSLNCIIDAQMRTSAASSQLTHELVTQLVGIGLLTRHLQESTVDPSSLQGKLSSTQEGLRTLESQSRLAMYSAQKYLMANAERELRFQREELINISDLLREMVDLLSTAWAQRDSLIRLHIDSGDERIRGDSSALRLLLFLILENAVKYSYHGSEVVVRLLSPFDPNRRRTAVRVQNVGVAVDPDEIPMIFKPGFRSRAAAGEVPLGAGLGLAAAQRIIQSFGGFIKIDSMSISNLKGTPKNLTTVDLVFPSSQG